MSNETVQVYVRISAELQKQLKQEAKDLGVSFTAHANQILERRNDVNDAEVKLMQVVEKQQKFQDDLLKTLSKTAVKAPREIEFPQLITDCGFEKKRSLTNILFNWRGGKCRSQ